MTSLLLDLSALRTMPGGDVLAELSDSLRDEAERIRSVEQAFRPGAWDESRASIHHSICAAAELIDRMRKLGEQAKERGQKPAPTVILAADVARSVLILECEGQGGCAAAPTLKAEGDDAAAA
jgi:hypothetical protein